MTGFFSPTILAKSKAPASLVPKCGACGLLKTCRSPKMPVSGEGRRRVLLVGEAPGADEDKEGIQFVGVTGQHLEKTLRRFNVDMRKDCWITNSIVCRPPGNATPTEAQISYCRPVLLKTIADLDPDVIILLGGPAVESLIGSVWKEDDVGGVMRWAGFRIPSQKPNAWICPTYHPSFVKRALEPHKGKPDPVPDLWFARHLEAAFELKGKPWKVLPQYEKQVRVVYDAKEAARELRRLTEAGRAVAFDYETNMAKPDSPQHRIVCCAVSDGDTAVAYPWHGRAIEATRELLASDTPKIAQGIQFEIRWTLAEFGFVVRNMVWCTMTEAHVIDNRRKITGLKFQAFVHLGAMSYDQHIKPYLKAPGSNVPNRIGEVDLHDLLFYCGLDALHTRHLADKQMEVLNYPKPEGM